MPRLCDGGDSGAAARPLWIRPGLRRLAAAGAPVCPDARPPPCADGARPTAAQAATWRASSPRGPRTLRSWAAWWPASTCCPTPSRRTTRVRASLRCSCASGPAVHSAAPPCWAAGCWRRELRAPLRAGRRSWWQPASAGPRARLGAFAAAWRTAPARPRPAPPPLPSPPAAAAVKSVLKTALAGMAAQEVKDIETCVAGARAAAVGACCPPAGRAAAERRLCAAAAVAGGGGTARQCCACCCCRGRGAAAGARAPGIPAAAARVRVRAAATTLRTSQATAHTSYARPCVGPCVGPCRHPQRPAEGGEGGRGRQEGGQEGGAQRGARRRRGGCVAGRLGGAPRSAPWGGAGAGGCARPPGGSTDA